MFSTSPYVLKEVSVSRVMLQVCAALLPGIAMYVWLLGPAILIQLVLASMTALVAEAFMLRIREKPVQLFLTDGSALVTAWLIALAFPPLAPWWLTVTGTAFALIIAKHLYGGLGQNPFNPAMVAFAVCIVSFPALMAQWPSINLSHDFSSQFNLIFGVRNPIDGLSGATPLDTLKTGLKLAEGKTGVSEILSNHEIFGHFAGQGWEWVMLAWLLGGLWLLHRKLITWHIPSAFIASMLAISAGLWLYDPVQFANPLFHLFSGGSMLGAFFIATDPVSSCTTPRGKLIFGAGVGLMAYIIRVFGGYPDGVAFAVLLLNLCVPLIDLFTQPPIFGMKDKA